jgi:uncharacterized protein YcnI
MRVIRNSSILGVLMGVLWLGWTSAAAAHVTPTVSEAPAGSYQVIHFRVTEGCAGAATTRLAIRLPAGTRFGKPETKNGWKTAIVTSNDVTEVSWTGGPLKDNEYGEFGIWLQLPPTAGVAEFPAIQSCATAENTWIERPGPDGTPPQFPIPTLTLTPALPETDGDHGQRPREGTTTTTTSTTIPASTTAAATPKPEATTSTTAAPNPEIPPKERSVRQVADDARIAAYGGAGAGVLALIVAVVALGRRRKP